MCAFAVRSSRNKLILVFMNVLYKRGSLIGIRYAYSLWGILMRLVLLGIFFKVSWVFACADMNLENWLIAVFFIFGFLMLASNKKKAVYDRETHRLILYRGLFISKGKKYDLPDLAEEVVFHTRQRIDYSDGGRVQRVLEYTDFLVKIPRELIELDSIPLDHSLKEQTLTDWKRFFAAIYDPTAAQDIPSRNTGPYLEMGMWILVLVSSGIAVYLNELSRYMH